MAVETEPEVGLDGQPTLDTETYAPPTTRIGSIAGVKGRISELKRGDQLRAEKRAQIDGIIDGNAPYVPEEMESSGRGDDANFNDRSAEGMVDAATTPYYELAFGVPKAVLTEISYTNPDGTTDVQQSREWCNKFDERFTKTLWGWPGYKEQLQVSDQQKVIYGRGPIIWHGRLGWHFESKRDDQVWVADDAMCDLSKLTEIAIPGHFTPVDLFKKVDNNIKDDSEGLRNGWDYDVAMEAIINAAPKHFIDTAYGTQASEWQTSLRRGDVAWLNKESRIYYTSYLTKEFTGKVSHVIVLDNFPGVNDGKQTEERFLYKKVAKFDSFTQVINPMFFSVPRDGHWYSVMGLGPKILDICDTFNRVNCTLLNGAMAGCGIVMQAQNAQALQKVQETPIVRASGMTFVPPDWSFAQSNIAPRLDGPLAIKRDLQGTLQSNTGQYRQRVSEENQEPTLGQAQLNAQQQATLSHGAYDRHYDQFDLTLREIIRRMLDPSLTASDPGGEEALEMRRQLVEEDEIPEEVLKFENFRSIKAMRSVGMGSSQMQQLTGQQLVSMVGTMDEEGRQNALRYNGAVLVGQSNVDLFWKPFKDLGVPNDQEAFATLENNVLRNADAQLVVTPGQNPAVHFITHYKDAALHLQALQQGQADPKMVVIHLDNVGPHNQMHLNDMVNDPTRKDQVAQFIKMHMALAKIADKLKQQVAQQQQQQQGQPGQGGQPSVSPEDMANLMKVMGDLQLKEAKQQADDQRKDQKLAADIHRKDLTAASNIYRKNAEQMNVPLMTMPQAAPVTSPQPMIPMPPMQRQPNGQIAL